MKWTKATIDMAYFIGKHMRADDREEVALSHGVGPMAAAVTSFVHAKKHRGIACDDGTPCGITGVNGNLIWMLGTDRLTEDARGRRQLVTEGREWVDECVKECGPLYNYVYAKNTTSIRWLSSLGFTVDHPEPYGSYAALFCRFWRDA